MRRAVVSPSGGDGLGNQKSRTSEARDFRIDSRKNFLSIHAHEHTKLRQFKVVSPETGGTLRPAFSGRDISAQHIVD